MYEINASEKERSLCEAHRKYMEEYNSQFSSGFRKGTEDAEMRLGLVIEEKDKQLAEKDRIIAELTAKLKNS